MDIDIIISKSIERVYQSWFINSEVRTIMIKETNKYLHRIYEIIKNDYNLQMSTPIQLMMMVGLDYGKVYNKNWKRISYNTLEEGVHNSLEYFLAAIR